MSSVADDLREDLRERNRTLPFQDRVDRVLEMGALALRVFADAQSLEVPDARKELQRRRQASRRPSACLEALLR
jgi:hypothetical protein